MATPVPFSIHWYAGVVPPFTGVGVNTTLVPGHIAPAGDATIVTDGTNGVVNDRLPKLVPLVPIVTPFMPVADEA